jgi:hypothetical protein
MTTPTLISAIYSLLLACAVPVALFCFVMAGFQLRQEGGSNFSAQGGFFKWLTWGAIFLTLTGIFAWLTAQGFNGGVFGTTGTSTAYTALIQKAVTSFIYDILRDRIAPLIAGALVLKALLDTGEGKSPFPSIISALFILGVGGFFTLANTSWNDGSQYATSNMLKNMLTWAMGSVAPVLGAMAIYGAIVQFVRKESWAIYLIVGGCLLMVPALWSLVQKWAGVTIS